MGRGLDENEEAGKGLPRIFLSQNFNMRLLPRRRHAGWLISFE